MKASRRRVLRFSAGVLAAPLLPASARAAIRLGRSPADELCALSTTKAVQRMRSGQLSAEDYAAALLQRAEERETLNAFLTLDRDQVLEAARNADKLRASGRSPGALHGLPMPVKDSVLTAEYLTTAGTKGFAAHAP
ncbi:MAG: hypothetical protein HYY48_02820 [Gammaproteobacteria bacterium]|nr:hypothetical protein [Gammaproteobacteria bacterium]